MLGPFITAVRRNHALEHATVSLLLQRLAPNTRMVGRATHEGFYLYADIPTAQVEACVAEGLRRLRQGERDLAISPLCGTNFAMAGILSGLASLAAMGGRPQPGRVPNVLLWSVLAVLVAQPLGRLVQRHLTTSPDLSDVEVVEVRSGGGRGLRRYHHVRTRSRSSPSGAEGR